MRFPEFCVLFCIILGEFFQLSQNLLGQGCADFTDEQVVLQGLAGDVQGQVLGVNNTLDEAQVFGEQVLVLLFDEHAAYIEVEAPVVAVHAEYIEIFFGDEEQGVELYRSIYGKVQGVDGRLHIVSKEFVELVVLFLLDLEFGLTPEGGYGVNAFAADHNRERNEIGVAFDDVFEFVVRAETLYIVFIEWISMMVP